MRIVRERTPTADTVHVRRRVTAADVMNYFDRVAKYVPVEIVAASIVLNGIASMSRKSELLFVLIFFVSFAATPFYIAWFTETKREAWINIAMAMSGFVVWTYAIGGTMVRHLGWYDARLGSAVLVAFTLASGAVEPVSKRVPAKPAVITNPRLKPTV